MEGYQKSFTNSPTHRRRRPCLIATLSVMLLLPSPPPHAVYGAIRVCGGGKAAPVRSQTANAATAPLLHEDVRLGPRGEARGVRVDRRVIACDCCSHSSSWKRLHWAPWQHGASTDAAQALVVAEASFQREKVGGGVGLLCLRRQIGRHVDS